MRGRYGPLYGYLVASAIFTALIYFLLFNVRDAAVESCERGNIIRAEFTAREAPIDGALRLLIDTRRPNGAIGKLIEAHEQVDPHPIATEKAEARAREEVAELRRLVASTGGIEQVDCEAVNPEPWPFG
jgi:hypothetical protein